MNAPANPGPGEKPRPPNEPPHSDEFLLQEYERLWTSFLNNEESGDKRVTFLWTLAGALLAGLGALATNEKMQEARHLDLILIFGCVASVMVFLFGWQTFARVLRRNCASDGHKRRLDKIRECFSKDEKIKAALLPYEAESRKFKYNPFSRGGYAETVALINSMLAGLAAGLLCLLFLRMSECQMLGLKWTDSIRVGHLLPPMLIAFLAVIILWILQACYAGRFYLAAEAKALKDQSSK